MTPGSASRIYEVRAEYGNGLVRAFGARRDRMEAEVLLGETIKRVEAAARARYDRYWIEEIDTTGLWQPPGLPTPRDRYTTSVSTVSPPGSWTKIHDSSWKIQYLDLSSIREGVIRRDERFGYLKLATDPKLTARDFIRCSSWQGERRVEFYIERGFSLTTGELIADEDW